MRSKFFAMAALAAAFLPTATFATSGKHVDPAVLSALKSIKRNADAVAAGRLTGKALQGPAREIALAWSKAAPALASNGDAIVETKIANASISAFERDWQTSKNIRSEAKDVSSNVSDLVGAVSRGG